MKKKKRKHSISMMIYQMKVLMMKEMKTLKKTLAIKNLSYK